MTIDIDKAKQSLATLQREKQEQNERLQRAREAKKQFDANRVFSAYKQNH